MRRAFWKNFDFRIEPISRNVIEFLLSKNHLKVIMMMDIIDVFVTSYKICLKIIKVYKK